MLDRPAVRITILGLTVLGAGLAVAFGVVAASDQFVYDAHAYWAADPTTAYTLGEGSPDALLYPPPMLLAFSLFKVVPWPLFAIVWSGLIGGAIALMAGPLTIPAILTNPIASEITLGNVHAFTGVGVILGLRWPAFWAFMLLTKVTTGVGLLWFVFRKEWRSLAIALGVTAAICLPTAILAPDLWARWVTAMLDNHGTTLGSGILRTPLWIRLLLAVPILWWGARGNRTWVVPIAVTLGLPVLWDHGLAIALASIWLYLHPDYPARKSGNSLKRASTMVEPAVS